MEACKADGMVKARLFWGVGGGGGGACQTRAQGLRHDNSNCHYALLKDIISYDIINFQIPGGQVRGTSQLPALLVSATGTE